MTGLHGRPTVDSIMAAIGEGRVGDADRMLSAHRNGLPDDQVARILQAVASAERKAA